jgi:hypothetical protein
VSPPTYITISAAAQRLDVTYRAARRLAARGVLRATAVDGHEDGRVRLLVSIRSVNAYARKRRKNGRRWSR